MNPAELLRHHISLIHGWVPPAVQGVAAAVLLLAVARRSLRWSVVWLPAAALIGAATAAAAHWYTDSAGLAGDPAPRSLWLWIGLTGLAVAVVAVGWRRTRWWRRAVSLLAVPLCLLSSALALNAWVGYFPTVQTAWNQLTSRPLPDQADVSTVTAMRGRRAMPPRGTILAVNIGDAASRFSHRGEFVYLPPAWYQADPPPKLPVAMMIGGEFNTPADWLRAGDAVTTIDDFASAHSGNAPVFVFVDAGGAFNNDTECVNGSRGNAADHLTKDVVPFMLSRFGVSAERANWGVVGWSMGGTCAVDLTVMHPETFSAFVDIAGDLGPNSGTKAQTIARLFGGNPDAWAAFDPTTVIARHGRYTGVSGWFAIPDSAPRRLRGAAYADKQTAAANSLCALGGAHGISCAVVAQPGKHDWPFAAGAFATALPWLAGQIGTPGVARIPLLPSGAPPAGPAADPTQSAQAAPRPGVR